MTRKATRCALAALTVVGAGALSASPAFAAPPTFYVTQPSVTAAQHVTPESAILMGSVDTGGSALSHFTIPASSSILWANSFTITNSSSSPANYNLEGLPPSGSAQVIKSYGASTGYSNAGSENHSTVLFEYDPAKDFAANGNNPGPQTGFAQEVDVPTANGQSPVSAQVGAYPAASGLTTGTVPLKPGTKYVYFLTQQAGATTNAQSYNTYDPTKPSTSTSNVNPTWSCLPTAYAAVTPPYNAYTSSGTLTGDGSTQPQIQGPCIYVYGGSANYYTSNYGTFTTPKLGFVTFQRMAKVSGNKASLKVTDHSVEAARGRLVLEGRAHHKMVSFAHGSFKVRAHHKKMFTLKLTPAGKAALAKHSPVSTRVIYTSKTDQPTHTKHIKLG